jgi:HEAT repeat protein
VSEPVPEFKKNRPEPPSRSVLLVSAFGAVGTLVLIVIVLFRVMDNVNQAVNKAGEAERERQEQVRRQIAAQLGGGKQVTLPAEDETKARAFRDVEHADPILRLESVDVIARLYLTDPRAVPALVKRLKDDDDARVRLSAIRALQKVAPRTEPIEAALRAAIDDKDPRVRAEATAALAKDRE